MQPYQLRKLKSLIALAIITSICLSLGTLGIVSSVSTAVNVISAIMLAFAIPFAFYSVKIFQLIKQFQSGIDQTQVANLLQQANSMIDVTKRLKDDQRNLVALLNSSSQGCWIKDTNNQFIFTNSFFTQVMGANCSQLNQLPDEQKSDVFKTIAVLDAETLASGETKTNSIQLQNQMALLIKSTPVLFENSLVGCCGWLSPSESVQQWDLIDIKTGLGNRDFAIHWLNEGISNCTQDDGVAVLILDINQFSNFISNQGYTNGDAFLKEASKTLAQLVNDDIQVARLEKDRFAILLKNIADPDTILTTLNNATASLNKPFTINSVAYELSFSAGLARYPENASSGWALLSAAEKDMIDSRLANKQH